VKLGKINSSPSLGPDKIRARFKEFFLPRSYLTGTGWERLWAQEERQTVRARYRITAPVLAIAYVLHFFLVDIPAGAQPDLKIWAAYRFSVATAYLFAFLYSLTGRFERDRFYRLPLYVVVIVSSYLLAHSMLWDGRVPLYFAVVIPIFLVWFLYLPAPSSGLLLGLIYSLQFPVLYRVLGPVSDRQAQILSPFIVGLLFIAAIRSSFYRDVIAFIQHHRLLSEQQRTIDIYSQLVDQTKAFAPKEIFNRIWSLHQNHTKSIVEATEEVLRPKESFVTCLYSDIRNHTAFSSDREYRHHRLVPNIQKLTEIVEDYQGIPRLIGDLIFVYFDLEPQHCLVNALLCASQLSEENRKMNDLDEKSSPVRRFMVLSAGMATVGNIGGGKSAREVTCLGTPANIVARIDEITKVPQFMEAMGEANVILSRQFAQLLKIHFPTIPLTPLDLKTLSVTIRSFEEETVVYRFEVNSATLAILNSIKKQEGMELPREAA
jgi:class 3 adenylate cyclase